LTGEIRNALGSHVYSRNAHGPYIRDRVLPDQTSTDRRDILHNTWAEVAERWNANITDEQRRGWHVWSMLMVNSKSPITPNHLDGRAAFMRLNMRLGLYGASYLDEPPWQQDVDQVTTLELAADADAQTLTLTFNPSPLPAGHAMMLMATPNMNLGRMFAGDKYMFLTYLDAGATSPQSIEVPWLAKPWPTSLPHTPANQTVLPGKKIFARARLLNLTNGAYSGNQVAVATTTGTGDAMLTTTVQLTNEDIKALPTTPFEIVPTPGPGKIIIPLHALIILDTTAAAYAFGGGTPGWQFTDPADYNYYNAPAAMAGPLTGTGKYIVTVGFPYFQAPDSNFGGVPYSKLNAAECTPANLADQPLLLRDDWTSGGNYTDGDAANSCQITVAYIIADVL
jgi:hypothetical protein